MFCPPRAPVSGHFEGAGPQATPALASPIFVGSIVDRVLAEGNGPAIGDYPAAEILAALEADCDHATVAIAIARMARND